MVQTSEKNVGREITKASSTRPPIRPHKCWMDNIQKAVENRGSMLTSMESKNFTRREADGETSQTGLQPTCKVVQCTRYKHMQLEISHQTNGSNINQTYIKISNCNLIQYSLGKRLYGLQLLLRNCNFQHGPFLSNCPASQFVFQFLPIRHRLIKLHKICSFTQTNLKSNEQ